MKRNYLYSVVVPVYRSEKSLEELFFRIRKTFQDLGQGVEVVFVNDCSPDDSWAVIQQLKQRFPHQVTAVQLRRNFGQHNALMCGFNFAKGDFVITIDDDLQIPPEEIRKLIGQQSSSQADLVYGVYENKKHSYFRNLGSNLVQSIFRKIFSTKGDITSFRLIKASLCESVSKHTQSFVFIDGLLHWHTQSISRVLVEHTDRKEGKSGYSLKKLLTLTANLLFNFTTFPLRMLTSLGAIFSVVSFGIGMAYLLRKLFYDVPMGYTSTIVAIFFSTSVLLLVIGVIGEYISRIYSLQNDKPQFSIQEVLAKKQHDNNRNKNNPSTNPNPNKSTNTVATAPKNVVINEEVKVENPIPYRKKPTHFRNKRRPNSPKDENIKSE